MNLFSALYVPGDFEWNALMNCVYLPCCVFMQMVLKVVIERQTSDRTGFIDFTSC